MASLKYVILLSFAFLLFSQAVVAQDVIDSLNNILGGDNLPRFYEENSIWVDFFLYLFLFIFVARYAFHKQEGMTKALPAVIGVALAIAASYGANEFNFRIGDLGPFALGIALLVIGFTVFMLIKSLGMGMAAPWAFAFVISYGFLVSAASELYGLIVDDVPLVASLLAIILVIAIIVIVISIVRIVSSGGKSDEEKHAEEAKKQGAESESAATTTAQTGAAATAEDKATEEQIKKAEELSKAEIDELEKLKEFLKQLQSTHLPPEQAKNVAGNVGDKLKATVKLARKYHEEAAANVKKAETFDYNKIKQLRDALHTEGAIDPADTENKLHKQIEKRLRNHILQAISELKQEKGIEQEIAQVKKHEEDAEKYINEVIQLLASGKQDDLNKLNGVITSALGEIEASMQGVASTERFTNAVGTRLSRNIGAFKRTVEAAKREPTDVVSKELAAAKRTRV